MIQLTEAAAAAAATTKTTKNENVSVITQNSFIFCKREKSKIVT